MRPHRSPNMLLSPSSSPTFATNLWMLVKDLPGERGRKACNSLFTGCIHKTGGAYSGLQRSPKSEMDAELHFGELLASLKHRTV